MLRPFEENWHSHVNKQCTRVARVISLHFPALCFHHSSSSRRRRRDAPRRLVVLRRTPPPYFRRSWKEAGDGPFTLAKQLSLGFARGMSVSRAIGAHTLQPARCAVGIMIRNRSGNVLMLQKYGLPVLASMSEIRIDRLRNCFRRRASSTTPLNWLHIYSNPELGENLSGAQLATPAPKGSEGKSQLFAL